MGQVAEIAPARALFAEPKHPYTELLISAIPRPDPSGRITGAVEVNEPPSRLQAFTGCPFRDRCGKATEICGAENPPLRQVAPERSVACHHA